jgi:hypothetical protein
VALGQIVRHSPPQTAMEIIRHFNVDIPVADVPLLLGALGFILLAVGLYRSHRAPRVAAILIGLGGAATLITSEGPIRPLLIAATGILLAAQSWLVAATSLNRPTIAGVADQRVQASSR